jgi:hypothetical protein
MTTTAERPTIERTVEIPRLENERAERYQARTLYTTMGPDRNLRAVAQQLNKSLTIIGRWSSEDDWPHLAAAYDQTLGNLAARDASASYRAELEDHRKRYGDMGKALYLVAAKMLKKLDASVATMEATPQTLAIASRAVTIAADLEAHALRLGDILPKLDHDVQD